ncbi:MAG: asparagine synthase (glutamine-hydrolyzing) [Planctomycetota bacterium]|nr:asparagine synthase (glutamine-hydrolyzing) [Planctomycetota bacterium]
MCGICGVVTRAALTPEHSERIRRISAAMIHRGPDGEGEHADAQVHLAMRRLAIIDLEGGWQPLYNEDRSIALVANGEVYNYVELQQDLESRGHRYRTHSDCESIIHAYEQHGLDFVHKLRGMYAFALYDSDKRRVILGRDRMGEKPLYLIEKGDDLWFASELRSIMSAGIIPFKLDPGAIHQYFHYQFVPEPATPIQGLRKLPAGHLMVIDLDSGTREQKCYWRLDDAPPVEGEPARLIREELERIATLITRADVPVGVALSAGVDSSAIAALVARARPGLISALTIGYPGRPRQDERSFAERWANELKMPFLQAEVSVREFVELFAERSFWRDDPIADTAGHSYFAVARLARDRRIPVLLQGQGGDELFWGYGWLQRAARMSRLKASNQLYSPRERLRRLRRRLPSLGGPGALKAWALEMYRTMQGHYVLNPDDGAPLDQMVAYNLANEYQAGAFGVASILQPEFLALAQRTSPASLFTLPRPWPDPGVFLTKLICDTYLMENGMVQGDRLSMVNSVELRLPLSDYKLAELAVGLRKARPDDHLSPKHHFRAAIRDLLPDWLLNRPKTGFSPPGGIWMSALVAAYKHSLADGYLVSAGLLNPEVVHTFQRHTSKHSPWTDLFYRTLVLEFWARGVQALTDAPLHYSLRVPALA